MIVFGSRLFFLINYFFIWFYNVKRIGCTISLIDVWIIRILLLLLLLIKLLKMLLLLLVLLIAGTSSYSGIIKEVCVFVSWVWLLLLLVGGLGIVDLSKQFLFPNLYLILVDIG